MPKSTVTNRILSDFLFIWIGLVKEEEINVAWHECFLTR